MASECELVATTVSDSCTGIYCANLQSHAEAQQEQIRLAEVENSWDPNESTSAYSRVLLRNR